MRSVAPLVWCAFVTIAGCGLEPAYTCRPSRLRDVCFDLTDGLREPYGSDYCSAQHGTFSEEPCPAARMCHAIMRTTYLRAEGTLVMSGYSNVACLGLEGACIQVNTADSQTCTYTAD